MLNSKKLGTLIRSTRKNQSLSQADLALVAGTAPRFISNLENGKETCHLGKTLAVLAALGITISLHTSIGDRLL